MDRFFGFIGFLALFGAGDSPILHAFEGFNGPDAVLTPLRDGNALDQRVFDRSLGLELGGVRVEKSGKLGGGFALDEDGLREDAVAGGVARGVEFALNGFGSGGFCGVGSVGSEALF